MLFAIRYTEVGRDEPLYRIGLGGCMDQIQLRLGGRRVDGGDGGDYAVDFVDGEGGGEGGDGGVIDLNSCDVGIGDAFVVAIRFLLALSVANWEVGRLGKG
jgi:hypothetical protein